MNAEKAVFRDVFNFHAERLEHLWEPDFWAHTDALAEALQARHGGRTGFCADLLTAVRIELGRKRGECE